MLYIKAVKQFLEYYESNYEDLSNRISKCSSVEALNKIIRVIEDNMKEYGKSDTDFNSYVSNPFLTLVMVNWILTAVEANRSIKESCTECLIYWTNTPEGRKEYKTFKLGDIVPIEKMNVFAERLKELTSRRVQELYTA